MGRKCLLLLFVSHVSWRLRGLRLRLPDLRASVRGFHEVVPSTEAWWIFNEASLSYTVVINMAGYYLLLPTRDFDCSVYHNSELKLSEVSGWWTSVGHTQSCVLRHTRQSESTTRMTSCLWGCSNVMLFMLFICHEVVNVYKDKSWLKVNQMPTSVRTS